MKANTPQGATVPDASVVSEGAKQALFARVGRKVARKFGSLETIVDICATLHVEGGHTSAILRAFCVRHKPFYGFIPPCGTLNGYPALNRCKVTGKVRPFFYSLALTA